jgi:hypothetical protein
MLQYCAVDRNGEIILSKGKTELYFAVKSLKHVPFSQVFDDAWSEPIPPDRIAD